MREDADVEVSVYCGRLAGWRGDGGAQVGESITEVAGKRSAYEWLGVEIVIAAEGQALDVERAIETRGRICRIGAPAAKRAGDYCAGVRVHGDYVRGHETKTSSETVKYKESRNGARTGRVIPNWEVPGARLQPAIKRARRGDEIDTNAAAPNNAAMTKPETVRRIKSYSSSSGYVYQYQFQDVHPGQRGTAKGNEYVYYVSADRKTMFPIRIFVRRDALEQWTKQTGRALTGTEEYAVAKMRLFQALDDIADFATSRPELVVDKLNLQTLLERLDL
jgi:hypothetical protein